MNLKSVGSSGPDRGVTSGADLYLRSGDMLMILSYIQNLVWFLFI